MIWSICKTVHATATLVILSLEMSLQSPSVPMSRLKAAIGHHPRMMNETLRRIRPYLIIVYTFV